MINPIIPSGSSSSSNSIEDIIFKKAVVEFEMAQEIALLFNQNSGLREMAMAACQKVVTILKYLTEFALCGEHYNGEGIDSEALKKFKADAHSDFFYEGADFGIQNGALFVLIFSELSREIKLNNNMFSLFNGLVDKDLLKNLGENDDLPRKEVGKVITSLVQRFDPKGQPIPSVPVTVRDMGELFSIFSNISKRIQRRMGTLRASLKDDSLPIGLKQFMDLGKDLPESRASKEYKTWKTTAFGLANRQRTRVLRNSSPIFQRLVQKFKIADPERRGMGKYMLKRDSIIHRMNAMFGLVDGADISGSVANYVYVIETIIAKEFRLTEELTLPKAAPVCYFNGQPCANYDPYVIFICFAALVGEFHHTVLEVALAMTINWETTPKINYAPGIYSSLIPANYPVPEVDDNHWAEKLRDILYKSEGATDNLIMLVEALNSYARIDRSVFAQKFVINQAMYSRFDVKVPGTYRHGEQYTKLYKLSGGLYNETEQRERAAEAAAIKLDQESWQLNFPNAFKAKASGNPDGYWFNINWQQLSATESLHWQVLGWNASNWDKNYPAPASYFKPWKSLSSTEMDAAEYLGYSYFTWVGAKFAIIEAVYGILDDDEKKIDITPRLQTLINFGKPILYVDNFMAGTDPAPHRGKKLWVRYSLPDGTEKKQTVNESGTITF